MPSRARRRFGLCEGAGNALVTEKVVGSGGCDACKGCKIYAKWLSRSLEADRVCK
jgi:hypothetical protein